MSGQKLEKKLGGNWKTGAVVEKSGQKSEARASSLGRSSPVHTNVEQQKIATIKSKATKKTTT